MGSDGTEQIKKVFVPLDGSFQQVSVLERAINMAAVNGAELYIGHVIEPGSHSQKDFKGGDYVESLRKGFRDSVQEEIDLAGANDKIPALHVQVETGRTRETIKIKMLDVIKPDLVVCGARGLSGIQYAILGSVSTYLIRNSECDVLVVR